jgi:hypothetical protein
LTEHAHLPVVHCQIGVSQPVAESLHDVGLGKDKATRSHDPEIAIQQRFERARVTSAFGAIQRWMRSLVRASCVAAVVF